MNIFVKENTTRTMEVFDLNFLELDDDGAPKINRPENALVRTPGYTNPIDFGSWCYTAREDSSREVKRQSNYISFVDARSFRKQRRFVVREFIGYLALLNDQSMASMTLKTIINGFRNFVDWCDLEIPGGIDSRELTNHTFKQYSLHLLQLVRLGKVNRNTAAAYQKNVLRALAAIFDDNTGALTRGVVHLSILNAARNSTECPEEKDAAEALRISLCLFLQLSDFTFLNENFPFQLELPHSKFWFFPNQMPFANGSGSNSRFELSCYLAYDYATGKLRSKEEIESLVINRGFHSRYAEKSLSQALKSMRLANSNPHHERRVFAASLAADSFFNLFAANTGMNASNICRIEWDDDYESVHNIVGFKTLKPRAGNKETEFVLSSGFTKHFKRYIKLRQYILNALGEADYPFLFFRCSNGKLTNQTDKFSNIFNNKINRNFGLKIAVTTRHWRVLKSDWLIRHTDVATAAMVLQNTVDTVMEHYAEGSPSVAKEEMTNYFLQYESQLIAKSTEQLNDIPAGSCASYGNPSPLNQESAAHVDCVSSEGCIGCEHYRVHPDTSDLHKLFSFKYVLQISLTLVHDDHQYERLVEPVLERIDKLVDLIVGSDAISDKDILDTVNAVFECEELSPYWSRKLDLLTRLEVL